LFPAESINPTTISAESVEPTWRARIEAYCAPLLRELGETPQGFESLALRENSYGYRKRLNGLNKSL
jgi:hypothetical protein